MKNLILCFSAFVMLACPLAADSSKGSCQDVRIKKFPIAVQSHSFSPLSFIETLDQVRDLGLHDLEVFPGQKLTSDPDDPTRFGTELTDSQIQWVRDQLEKRDIGLISFGTIRLDNEDDGHKIFEFARKMEIQTILAEPDSLDPVLTERLVQKFNIKVVLQEMNPDTLLSIIKGMDPRIGTCADIGFWMRSGICPVKALKTLNRRIRTVYLPGLEENADPEISEDSNEEGKVDIQRILAELTFQDYDGILMIGSEPGKDVKDISRSISLNMDKIRGLTYYQDYNQLLSRRDGKYNKHGWNHYGPGHFLLDEKTGILKGQEGMGLLWYSARKFKDFTLELDFMSEDHVTNSGIFLRIPEMPFNDDYIYQCYEIQIDNASRGIHQTGAVYDALAPSALPFFEPGEWNHYKITFQKMHLRVELNGVQIVDWTAEPRGKVRSLSDEGYIGLQNHDSRAPVYFKNIFIKEI